MSTVGCSVSQRSLNLNFLLVSFETCLTKKLTNVVSTATYANVIVSFDEIKKRTNISFLTGSSQPLCSIT